MEEGNTFNDQSFKPEYPEPGEPGNSSVTGFFNNLMANRLFRSVLFAISALAGILIFIVMILYISPVIAEISPVNATSITNDVPGNEVFYKKQISAMTRDIQRLVRKYSSYTTGQSYVVINTTENKFFLYRNKELIREGFCSSGSYTMLRSPEGDRNWIFKTPKGKYRIQGKITNPVWRKPDWAFVEEGLPIPTAFHPTRYEYGVLGDYALSLGDGYLIHGTLYKRFLGMPVTHGCVRLNDEDLEAIYKNLDIGSKVYIF